MNFFMIFSDLFFISLCNALTALFSLVSFIDIVPALVATTQDLSFSIPEVVDLITLIEVVDFILASRHALLHHSTKKRHTEEEEVLADAADSKHLSFLRSFSVDLLQDDNEQPGFNISLSNIDHAAVEAKQVSISNNSNSSDLTLEGQETSQKAYFPHTFADCFADVYDDSSKYAIEYIECDQFPEDKLDDFNEYTEEIEKVADKMSNSPLLLESKASLPHSYAECFKDSDYATKVTMEYTESDTTLESFDDIDVDPDLEDFKDAENDEVEHFSQISHLNSKIVLNFPEEQIATPFETKTVTCHTFLDSKNCHALGEAVRILSSNSRYKTHNIFENIEFEDFRKATRESLGQINPSFNRLSDTTVNIINRYRNSLDDSYNDDTPPAIETHIWDNNDDRVSAGNGNSWSDNEKRKEKRKTRNLVVWAAF